MADDLTNRGPADAARVNINEPHEVAYWTKKWSVTAETLERAVRKVGVMAKDVAFELGK